jgi:hypothetical protein|tara:strand:+ start:6684 stop:8840 length:2157 start_codon:yes stop_codon:yes gene_type:complete
MFQGQVQNVQFPAPYRGMDSTIDNNPEYAKYLQNMLISDNNTCTLRYGTRLIAAFPFDENRIFRSQIATMSHLGASGNSEKIVYQNYLSNMPYLTIKDTENVIVEEIEGEINVSKISIDTTTLDQQQKDFLAQRINNNVYFYIRQESRSDGADISNVVITENQISFTLPFPRSFFDIQLEPLPQIVYFELWWERGALYKLENNNFNVNPLREDLDPNVIISHINYQGKLLIANGVDPVFIYDGNVLQALKGNASVLITGNITKNANVLTFNIPQFFQVEMEKYVTEGSSVTVINSQEEKIINVTIIAFALPVDNNVVVTLTLAEDPPDNVRTILYKKDIPPFNFLTVANDRLWALAEGRGYKNKFRPSGLAMKAYYASDRKSVDGWFNQKTNEIEFIDLSTNSAIPDNLETIIPFQSKVLFLGRETTQVWQGEDPTVIDDGQNIALPDFKWEMTLPVGIIQKSLFVEIPNDFVFLSKYGIVSLSSINQYKQLSVSYNFSNGINQHLKAQLEFIENDRDYRDLKAFLYPYGRFLGFKLKYNCLIYQLKQTGAWSIFSENFAESRSIFYDPVSQDLFLGMDDGVLLAYADKTQTQTYEEYAKSAMIWRIHYSWIYPSSTWNNEAIFIACRTLNPIDINVQVFKDYSDANSDTEIIRVEQSAGLYDNAQFGISTYSYREGNFPYEIMRFMGDSVMIVLHGEASDQFIFDKLFLTGGVVNGN